MPFGVTYKIVQRRPKNVTLGRVLTTSYFNVLRTYVGDVPWHYIEDHTGTSIGRLLETSSGRPRDLVLPSGIILDKFILGNFENFILAIEPFAKGF